MTVTGIPLLISRPWTGLIGENTCYLFDFSLTSIIIKG